jgi:glycosyltransferase involved in cell wall biosynthesis
MKPVIVHISNDYPDPLIPDKTRAIVSLVEGTPEFRHIVYSLNRVDGWNGIASIPFGEDRTAVAYKALPKGILWEKRLKEVAEWIAADLKQKNIKPDLVEAHKFTIEGVIGYHLSETFNCPLVCDIQGGTDVRVLRMKIRQRDMYKAIAEKAALVFPFAPWMMKPFQAIIGLDPTKCRLLPVITGIDTLSPAPPIHQDRLISVFHLDSWKRKNIRGMIDALKKLKASRPAIILDIYGRGSAKTLMLLQAMIDESGMGGHVVLKGPTAHGALPDIMKNYAAMILPTHEETYGLVYVEALFAGLPILFTKNKGIDGIFDTDAIGYACDAGSVDDIAAGIKHLLVNEAELKRQIGVLQADDTLSIVRKSAILDTYRSGLMDVLARK